MRPPWGIAPPHLPRCRAHSSDSHGHHCPQASRTAVGAGPVMGPVVFLGFLAPLGVSGEHSVGRRGQETEADGLAWKGRGVGGLSEGAQELSGGHSWGASRELGVPSAPCTPRGAGWKRIPEFGSRGHPSSRGCRVAVCSMGVWTRSQLAWVAVPTRHEGAVTSCPCLGFLI